MERVYDVELMMPMNYDVNEKQQQKMMMMMMIVIHVDAGIFVEVEQ
jgi:hypothetical protein